ncbi:MAG: hypothetical protein JWP81_1966 [Ferruginibacter sp.]|nr:hypothetical protein [Ferruginibacter sp.]
MKKFTFILLTLLAFFGVNAQNKIYDAATLPEELKKDAYSVKREEKIEFEVKSMGKASLKIHTVVTVLNENGKDQLDFQTYSDQFHSLENFSIQLFDSKGVSVKKYKRSDLYQQASQGSDLITDGKMYFLRVPASAYPVTIQTDYEISYSGILRYPAYQLQMPEQSVENSVFVATVPTNLDLRFKGRNTSIVPVITNDEKVKTYTWSIKNLPALEYEEGSVSYENRYPNVLLSPNKFEMDGYEGDMSSWQNYGKWIEALGKNTGNLTEERKQFFQALVKDAATDRDKAKIIYKYLQDNFRYVSIQLGIGGLRPFPADFVDKKKYGDCKALSNYMKTCLNAVGIRSHYTLINASYNEEPVDPAFPYDGFDHIILCVPFEKDSVWLECTSNISEFGVLGNFTENRNGLLITEDGGKLVPTPKSKASDNMFSSTSIIELAENGSGTVKVILNASGEYKRDLIHYISNQKKDDQKDFLVNYFGYMQPDDFEINYDQADKNAATPITMSIGKIPEFTAGKKVFLNPRIYKIWGHTLPKAENRKQDYYFPTPFIKTDTTIYQLPEGFGIETLPKGKHLSFEFGSFNSSYEFDESKKRIRSVARLELDQYKIPAAKFLDTKKFFNEVLGEYTEKIVIRRLQ